jgi:DNA invertase Pin-like site-specific DNA recombinase
MRVAIYARVSSERQEKEHTIGSQLEALRNYAAQNGMEIVEEFTDEGYSGARLDRPALDRMRDLAERRGFEALLTYCTDRLARKFVLQALILEEMERFGVKTIFLEGGAADDPLSKLMHQITGAVAEFERAKIVERNRRGKLYRARCGEVITWRAPFGYVRIPRRDGVAPHVEIDENKAGVEQLLYQPNDRFAIMPIFVYQRSKDGNPQHGWNEWISFGARPQIFFTKYVSLAFERGFDHTNSPGQHDGWLRKFTIAPQIGAGRKFYSRPVLRAFLTYASWSDGFRGLVGGVPYLDRTNGLTYGVQAETWW